MNQEPILLWLVCLPLIGTLFCAPVSSRIAKFMALVFSLAGFCIAIITYVRFDAELGSAFQMQFILPWIAPYNITFALGVDALSLPLVALTKLMVPVAILASFSEEKWNRGLLMSLLVLDSAMTGTFLATDLFLFYIFWEMMLIPMALIIGVWGSAQRIYAAVKFFLYTFAGSIFMLVAIFYIFNLHFDQFGFYTAEIAAFSKLTFSTRPVFLGLNAQEWVFLAFLIAFAIKVPLFPFHTWLPDAHVQAPTGGSVVLAAVLLKMGTYGLLRFCVPITSQAFVTFIPLLVVLSLIGILYGAWVAYHQEEMKKLIAYSSVSHLGFIVLGICAMNTIGLTGAMLQMVNHGISSGALFLLAGILYERRHSKLFADYGGLAKQIPWYAFFLAFVGASSMAVPGLNGFVGEFLILIGTFQTNPLWAVIAVFGVIFAAAYILLMLRRVLFGPLNNEKNKNLRDISLRDCASLVPLSILIIWLGVYPNFFINKLKPGWESYWSSAVAKTSSTPTRELPSKFTETQTENKDES